MNVSWDNQLDNPFMGSKAYLSYIPTVSLHGIPLWINHFISEPSLRQALAQIKDLQAKYGESSPVIAALHLEIMGTQGIAT